MDHYTKTKPKIEAEIKRLQTKIRLLRNFIKGMRKIESRLSVSREEEDIKETKKDIILLKKRLVCKHSNRRKEEIESYHNGDISTYYYCTDCEQLMESY